MTPFQKFCLHTRANLNYKHSDFETDFNSVYEYARDVECKTFFKTKAEVSTYVLNSMIQGFNAGTFHKNSAPHWMACLQKHVAWAGVLGWCCREAS